MIEKLQLLYPALNPDLLSLLLDNAKQYLMGVCNLAALPSDADSVIFRMVQEDINRLHAEGINSESTGGNSQTYNTDYSTQTMRLINKFKRIRTV